MGVLNWKLNYVSKGLFKKFLILKVNNELKGCNKIIFKKLDWIIKNLDNK